MNNSRQRGAQAEREFSYALEDEPHENKTSSFHTLWGKAVYLDFPINRTPK